MVKKIPEILFRHDCGYETRSKYTADVINEQTGACPACEQEARPENFTPAYRTEEVTG